MPGDARTLITSICFRVFIFGRLAQSEPGSATHFAGPARRYLSHAYPRRPFRAGPLQFITTRTYRRNRLFTCQLNVFSEKKHPEKLDDLHHNTVKRRLVSSADQ